jgi:hypothetical protein
VGLLSVQGLSMVRKWLVHPEPAMADSEVCVVSEPIALQSDSVAVARLASLSKVCWWRLCW